METSIIYKLRQFIFRTLGLSYKQILANHDFVYLKNDNYTNRGIRTYDNGAKVWRWSKAKVVIGNYCSIANNINFIVDEGYHNISSVTSFPLALNLYKDEKLIAGVEKSTYLERFNQKEGIEIGHDVWIGMGTYILPGVKIGNGVTVAANSVVTKDLDDYTVVGGVPAALIKRKHTGEQIDKLNKIAWWNWSENIIKERLEDFHLPIENFIEKYS